MMIEFKDISKMLIDELFQELGIADYTYIETSNFLEHLEQYRQKIHLRIKDSMENVNAQQPKEK